MRLHDLKAPKGANRARKRVGRGESSGWGKFSGRGSGGTGQRSGRGKPSAGFEGGQTPMYRRMPKRGFTNIFAKRWAVVNLDLLKKHFAAGGEVSLESLRAAGLAAKRDEGVRVLGRGEIDFALNIKADHVSAAAKAKIEAAGGKVDLVPERAKWARKSSEGKGKAQSKSKSDETSGAPGATS
jgi:large subunit ribosomal protein L15